MFKQTSIGKAFEINKNRKIYGTFAEIGAGQETVNFFYRAGLASQTVAKSMSAYDMTVSDEIYGKQNRYVCKTRLINMLDHEYRLLEKRLKEKHGNQTCFFVFASTAVTSSKKSNSIFSNNQHAWVGLRFQSFQEEAVLKSSKRDLSRLKLGNYNDVIFHVNCLDKNRLQQHEALGILGVNLIYAVFYHKKNPKQFIKSLNENLSGSRLEIHAMSFSGPDFSKPVRTFKKNLSKPAVTVRNLNQKSLSKSVLNGEKSHKKNLSNSAVSEEKFSSKSFSNPAVNLEILSQKLSSLAFFPTATTSEFLSDWTFNKNLVVLYGRPSLFKNFEQKKEQFLKTLKLTASQTHCVAFVPQNKISPSQFHKNPFPLLVAQEHSLDKLKKLISLYAFKPLVFVLEEQDFKQKLFDKQSYQSDSLLKALGDLFNNQTQIAVLSNNKNFSVEKCQLKQASLLKDYLCQQKQLLTLYLGGL